MAQPDVLIIGGGVIGASIAYHLAEAGTRVMVLERGQAGGHASLASAGLLHPHLNADVAHPVRDLSLASFALYPNLVARLREITGIDPAYQVPGILMVALCEDEVELHAAELSDPLAETYGLRLLSGDEARVLEPGLSPRVAAAVHKPRGAQVYAPSLLQAYTHAAARLGATVRRGGEGTDLCVGPRRGTGGRTAARLGVTLPVYPMRGQILALHAIPAPLRHIVFGADVYLAPKAEGSLIVGATYEEVGFDDRLTAAGVGWLLGAAQTVVPSLADATFRQAWVGLRPASPDRVPLLGPVPGWEGVTIAVGHTAEGVLLSAITGKVIAQHVRGEPTDLPLEPFSPARFGT